MSLRLLILLLLCSAGKLGAQSLVANGSFEDRNQCIEYRSACSAEGWFRIPLLAVSSIKGTAGFFLGNHHESIVMENIVRPGIFRSYLYTRLLCPLQAGREYVIGMSVRTADRYFDHTDIYLLDVEPFHHQSQIMQAKQKLAIKPADKIKDAAEGWKDYAIRFTASGTEKYLLIGNLTKGTMRGKEQNWLILYDIDNVTLLPVDTTLKACADRAANEQRLYANNYRHTPNRFLDSDEDPAPVTIAQRPAETTQRTNQPAISSLPVNDTLVIPDVLFRFDKSELNPLFSSRIDTLVAKIKTRSFQRIEVLGHTDSLGTDAYNLRLSQSRAETVKEYLIRRLVYPPDRIITRAFAASLPRSTNSTATGRQLNRRVEIVLVK
ncbi:OmpA family protein [Sediminibacterium soli]|uniref:OmpA family protein n=1 Tax=Sediminibacterium soli TaxID=2698829 RepID=UPI00137AF51C|nr:OmpA family protein [Sediminibacterium soli]NCI47516.1 OmpA family protein [Sediminibacterium soli]